MGNVLELKEVKEILKNIEYTENYFKKFAYSNSTGEYKEIDGKRYEKYLYVAPEYKGVLDYPLFEVWVECSSVFKTDVVFCKSLID